VLWSKRITEIHSFIKLLRGLKKLIKLQWISSCYGVVGNEMADYLAEKTTAISQVFTCKPLFHSAKLK
jgi:hypothetical protein